MTAVAAPAARAGRGQRRAPDVGIGLRQPHYEALFDAPPALGFVEVHSENFFADGGAALAVLQRAREHWPVSLHGVGLALGSAAGVDPWHLDRLARLVRRIEPARVSDHACFARAAPAPGAPVLHANDLLPIAFTDEALDLIVTNVGRVQDRLGRPLLVENLSAYVSYTDDAIAEPEFFARLCRRSGCGLLLDVNNLMVNALNTGAGDPVARCCGFVDALPLGIVGEIHLAGYSEMNGAAINAGTDRGSETAGEQALDGVVGDRDNDRIVIDDHGSRVRPAVWAVYEHALRRFGATMPSLIEWDTDLPALEVLLDEAARATAIATRIVHARPSR